jgi:hypothetical protein
MMCIYSLKIEFNMKQCWKKTSNIKNRALDWLNDPCLTMYECMSPLVAYSRIKYAPLLDIYANVQTIRRIQKWSGFDSKRHSKTTVFITATGKTPPFVQSQDATRHARWQSPGSQSART